ncbi:MAG: Bax inhibitor-1/YccA family protein [Bacteroidaceae bacterium]|nr:Bax inhibitor-1/YccA family protein [Bacteroidaceae bacterium]
MDNNYSTIALEKKKSAQMAVFRQVYIWMSLALFITGITALIVANNNSLIYSLMSNQLLFWVLIIGEVVMVAVLAARIHKLSLATATVMFIAYSIINGVTMSLLFLLYTSESIASTFFITAGTFGAISAYGYFTKKDLSSLGSILIMALIGILIASLVNIFLESSTLYWIISYVGVAIFVGLTAYDTQKIKESIMNSDVNETAYKIALMGALELYLDFINLFIYLLRIFGDRD